MKALVALAKGAAMLTVVAVAVHLGTSPSASDRVVGRSADSWKLEQAYSAWVADYEAQFGAQRLAVGLGWAKSLSVQPSSATGHAVVDYATGEVRVDVSGVDDDRLGNVWLVDNAVESGAAPDADDAYLPLGRLHVEDGVGKLRTTIDPALLEAFQVDMVAVARTDAGVGEGGVLFGMPSLFQRIYVQSLPGAPEAGPDDGVLASLFGARRAVASAPGAWLAELASTGEEIFLNETFAGNGRTCGTCHRPDNNFTLDPDYIARLPASDPLFVHETNDSLNAATNGGRLFEHAELLRKYALNVANADGFDDLRNKYVLRSPSNIGALAMSMAPVTSGRDGGTVPPEHRLGWGGDGSPGNGTLREFALNAVPQHFPLTLGRQDGVDFRMPTDAELDALEAYMLSIGRRVEYDLETMVFTDENVSVGQAMFLKSKNDDDPLPAAKCQRCHRQGGAEREAPRGGALENWNFEIGIQHIPHPAEEEGYVIPPDAGFGTDFVSGGAWGDGAYGNGGFNTVSIVEAADTAPYFHDHKFATLEEAIEFYTTEAFNDSSDAGMRMKFKDDTTSIDLTEEQIDQVSALLRVVNAIDNIRAVRECNERARDAASRSDLADILRFCDADVDDAIEVLSGSPLGLHPVAIGHLEATLMLHAEAVRAGKDGATAKLDAALQELDLAVTDMVEGTAPSAPYGRRAVASREADAAKAEGAEQPTIVELAQNYPNPFNPTTRIRYRLGASEQVTLVVFDIQGRVVRRLVDEVGAAGEYDVEWNGRDDAGREVASGTYLYRLQAGAASQIRTMVLVR